MFKRILFFILLIFITACGGGDGSYGDDVGSWSILTIDTIGSPPIVSNSLALDANNKVHIGYSDFVTEEAKYATNAAGFWDIYVIDTNISKYGDVSIAVDSKGAVHIIYKGEGSLKYATNSSGSWVVEVVDSQVGDDNSIAVDLNDNIHISYSANNTDIISYPPNNKDIKYAINSSGSWVVSTIYSSESIIENISLALDSFNNAHLSFCNYDYVNYLNIYDSINYLTNVSGSWSAMVIDSEIGASGYYSGRSSISIDSQEKVHISYNNVGDGTLKYATNASGSWVVSELGGLQGWGTSLAIDSLDKIHITSWELNNLDLIYITNVLGEWNAELVDTEGNVGGNSRIKIDSEDKIHIIYLLNVHGGSHTDLKYAFK